MINTTALTRRAPAALAPDAAPSESLEEALLALWNGLESADSRRGYRDDWRRWVSWCATSGLDVLEVRPLHVQRYVKALHEAGKSKATRARALSVIRQTYAALVVAGLVSTNPAREVKNIRVSSDPRTPWLSEEELGRLLARPSPSAPWIIHRDWLICATIVGTSLRRREAARLRFDALVPVVGGGSAARVCAKGGKVAFVTLPMWLSDAIEAWGSGRGAGSDFVFPSRRGGSRSVNGGTVCNAVKRTAALARLDLSRATPHALRRSFATITRQKNVPLKDVQVAMLHASQSTTELYDKAATLPKDAPGEVFAGMFEKKRGKR